MYFKNSIILFIAMSLHIFIPFLPFWVWEEEEVNACGQFIKFNWEFGCWIFFLQFEYQILIEDCDSDGDKNDN